MNILFLGDIVGRCGRDAVIANLAQIRQQYDIDCCIVNAENAAGGFGITPEIYHELRRAGADIVTTGNHVWDQKEIMPLLDRDDGIIRAANFPQSSPGRGITELKLTNGKIVVVLHLLGQLFMAEQLNCPFATAETILAPYKLGKTVHAIIVDFHAEANSEKAAMGHFLDGKVSMVVGTHTHIPTADAYIMPNGTAYQTDAGMCGDYNSVIGFVKDAPLQRFTQKRKAKLTPAMQTATICGIVVKIDAKTGLANSITQIKQGGVIGDTTDN